MPRKKPAKPSQDVEQTTAETTEQTHEPASAETTSEPLPTSTADATETAEQTADEQWPPPLGLDDTMRCPLAKTCAHCRSTTERTIITVESEANGVLCMTLCGDCVENDSLTLPDYAWPTALRKIAQHAGHVGMNVDEMHAVMLAERAGQARPTTQDRTPAKTGKRAAKPTEDETAAVTDDVTEDQAEAEPLAESA